LNPRVTSEVLGRQDLLLHLSLLFAPLLVNMGALSGYLRDPWISKQGFQRGRLPGLTPLKGWRINYSEVVRGSDPRVGSVQKSDWGDWAVLLLAGER
jgi:hypothetical protein